MPKRVSLFCRYSATLVESSADVKTTSKKVSLRLVNKWVKPGKFFPESMLKKEGDVKPIPDISDKMPRKVISATIHRLKITVFEFQDSSTRRHIPCQQRFKHGERVLGRSK